MADSTIPADKLALYDRLVSQFTEFERLGKTMPYTSANTHMFSIMTKEGRLGIRLSKEDQQGFHQKYGDKAFRNYGAVMKDYVEIPDHLLADTNTLKPYLQKAYTYVMSLKANPRKSKSD